MTGGKSHSRRGWMLLAACGLLAAVGQAGCADGTSVEPVLRPDGGPQGPGGGAGALAASGGTTGAGGQAGAGGLAAAGGVTGAAGAAVVTFTQLYQNILSVSCTGSQCHTPGTQGGVSFGSPASAYKALSRRVIPGDAEGSAFYVLLDTGQMPPTDNLSAAALAQVASWIDAGALNN